jgi:hypothetical protein
MRQPTFADDSISLQLKADDGVSMQVFREVHELPVPDMSCSQLCSIYIVIEFHLKFMAWILEIPRSDTCSEVCDRI